MIKSGVNSMLALKTLDCGTRLRRLNYAPQSNSPQIHLRTTNNQIQRFRGPYSSHLRVYRFESVAEVDKQSGQEEEEQGLEAPPTWPLLPFLCPPQ